MKRLISILVLTVLLFCSCTGSTGGVSPSDISFAIPDNTEDAVAVDSTMVAENTTPRVLDN